MSLQSLESIIDRIMFAGEKSPIAVFAVRDDDKWLFDAVFGATTESMRRIKNKDPNYVGSFCVADWIIKRSLSLYELRSVRSKIKMLVDINSTDNAIIKKIENLTKVEKKLMSDVHITGLNNKLLDVKKEVTKKVNDAIFKFVGGKHDE